ncbi:hypothetical protein PgNI_05920 [Pyricularia grisea]|uniref:Uncharacterized protein n=1 Tax=Pyricularia grisea TaxID=148305 RepID=A0A6P8B4W7_PYRGI|nr:hypothetical protein PgNI_05920 [Pyricularia grisea]TLD10308.1 hypothetical protein PgNI_05920 [Pyricularia grisea]
MAPCKSGEAGKVLVSIPPYMGSLNFGNIPYRLRDAADTYQPRALAKIFKAGAGTAKLNGARSDGDRIEIANRSD